MLKDTINSVFDNLRERTTNPFLGTLAIVWLLKNWKLVYSLFYFDSKLTLEYRLNYITKHFSDKSFVCNMLEVILITVGVLIITYGLLTLSRLITDFFGRIVTPYVSKWTDKSSVVLKSEYILLQEVAKQLELRVEEERLAKVAAQKERDSADLKLADILSNRSNNDNNQGPTEEKTTDKSFMRIADKAKQKWTPQKFNNYIGSIKGGTMFQSSDEIIRDLLIENLITLSGSSTSMGKGYKFTGKGEDFIEYWNNLPIEDGSV